jgi:uncharacterized protein (DUF849 family)
MKKPVIIMAAPNGAHKTQQDHPALPVSIEETVKEALRCHVAGATVLHAHVRGKQNEHVLDVGLYRELIAEMNQQVPDMLVQITTEAVGRYNTEQQVNCVQSLLPEMISIALREITAGYAEPDFARAFFTWATEARIHIQHILFSSDDLSHFIWYKEEGLIPESHRCVLFVLGRYAVDFQSTPADLAPFLQGDIGQLDWFTCAFGREEQACVMAGIKNGGHARIGFENNLYLPSGELASSTASLVDSLTNEVRSSGRIVADPAQTRTLLGIGSE